MHFGRNRMHPAKRSRFFKIGKLTKNAKKLVIKMYINHRVETDYTIANFRLIF